MTSITLTGTKQLTISKKFKNVLAIAGIAALQITIIYEAMPLAVEAYRFITCQNC